MEEFFKKFPSAGYVLLCGLIAAIAWMAQQGLANNTKAMDRLTVTIEKVDEKLDRHEVKLENHEVRIGKMEGGK